MTLKAADSVIHQRLTETLRARFGGDLWLVDFDQDAGWVVYERIDENDAGQFRLGVTVGPDGALTLNADEPEAVRPETDYVAKRTAVKFVKGSDGAIEGLGIPYGGPFGGKDLDGEFFTAKTDFCLDWFPARPVIYDHGFDDALKVAVIGRVEKHEPTDEGIWVQAQLDRHHRYLPRVQELVEKSALGFSSGAMPHLVQKVRKTGEITRWPWVELSTTPIPTNPDAVVYAVKSSDMLAHLAALDEGSGSESFDDQLARVASEVEQVMARMGKRVDLRAAKVGREFSATNRQWLQSLDERLASLAELRKEISVALARTDPEAEKRAALAEFERFRALTH